MAFAAVILSLVFIVLIHELGHFLAARFTGIRATKFWIFFPPGLYRKNIRGVEFGIGSIPLGGYVKLPGMYEPDPGDMHRALSAIAEAEKVDDDLIRDIDQISGCADADAAAPIIDSLRDRGGKRLTNKVHEFAEDLHADAYWRAALHKRMIVIFAGPLANILLAFLVLFATHTFHEPVIVDSWRIGEVVKGSTAERAGVKVKDEVVEWNGKSPEIGDERFYKHIGETVGGPIRLVVRREVGAKDGKPRYETFQYNLTPKDIDGKKRVGITPGLWRDLGGFKRQHPAKALSDTRKDFTGITVGSIKGLLRVVTPEGRKEITTFVGFVQVAPEVERAGHLPQFIAFISLAVAIMNLLPLLPLDGGHLLFGIIEFFRRGRPMSRLSFERYAAIGLTLMLVLFSIGLRNDLL